MRYQGYLQPIVVRRTGTHEQMVMAAARASVSAWLVDRDNPAWGPWLSGSFGKSVRRARPVEIEKASEFFLASVAVGEAEAFAGLPVASEDMPVAIRKLQVTGTDAERAGWHTLPQAPDGSPRLVVNSDAGMSTGKTCAQVAHGLFGWALQQSEDRLREWQAAGMPLALSEAPYAEFVRLRHDAVVVIADAGHTEVEPGTETVLTLA